jgi:suppressor of G2 allele of SKP1
MDLSKAGAAALAAGDASTAVTKFTKALLEHPTSPDYLSQRSAAFTRLKPPRHDLALKDAELAVLCGRKRASRRHIQAAQLRRVIALYHNERYAEAKYVLDTMERWFSKEGDKDQQVKEAMNKAGEKKGVMEAKIWRAKVERKLAESGQQEVTEGEYPEGDINEKALVEMYKSQLGKDGQFYAEWKPGQDNTQKEEIRQSSTTSNDALPTQTTAPPAAKIRHEWFQNPTSITLTIYAKGVSKDRAQLDIQDDSVHVSFPHPADPNSTFSLDFDPLHALIDANQSTAKVMSTKIELILKKAVSSKWPSLEGSEPLKKDTDTDTDPAAKAAVLSTFKPLTESAPSYPTSSKSGPKNWDKLANDLTKKRKVKKNKDASDESDDAMDIDDDEFGGDAVDGFFKKLYKDSDDDTRRAMMKSFQESNGTALSTNWGEVGKGRVEEVKSKDD